MTTITQSFTAPTTAPTPGESAALFDTHVTDRLAWEDTHVNELGAWTSQANTVAGEVDANAAAAVVSANNAASSAGATLWVSGTTYAQGAYVRSPSNSRIYRRTTASGSGTTDPSADTTNYTPVFLDVFSGLPTIRPSLNLDFANSQLVDPRISFTRASTAQRTNAFGLLESVAVNTPRIDYDPVTGACKGLLIEESRTNLLTYSEQFDNAAWTKSFTSITANQTASPDGTVSMDSVLHTGAGGALSQSATITASSTVSVSVYAEKFSSDFIRFEVSNLCSCWFNLASGVVGSNNAGSGNVLFSSKAIESLGNGIYRCSLTVTTAVITTIQLNIQATDTDGTGASINSSIYIWGAQLEAGSFATSYIPTTTVAVTRAADAASMTGANFSSWYRNTEGSFIVSADMLYVATGLNGPYKCDDGSDVNRIMTRNANSGQLEFHVVSGNVSVADLGAGNTLTTGTRFTHAGAYKANDFASSFNGAAVLTDSAGAIPTGINRLLIGDAGSASVNGHIYNLSYYPKRVSNAELQGLSS